MCCSVYTFDYHIVGYYNKRKFEMYCESYRNNSVYIIVKNRHRQVTLQHYDRVYECFIYPCIIGCETNYNLPTLISQGYDVTVALKIILAVLWKGMELALSATAATILTSARMATVTMTLASVLSVFTTLLASTVNIVKMVTMVML